MILFTDVDGVLTDGKVSYPGRGRLFDTRDGHAVKMAQEAGWDVVFLSGEDDESIRARARKLNVPFFWTVDKLATVQVNEFFQDYKVTAFIGDDLPDMPLLKAVTYSACPADASLEVIQLVSSLPFGYVSNCAGGDRAFRSFVEWLISTSNKRP